MIKFLRHAHSKPELPIPAGFKLFVKIAMRFVKAPPPHGLRAYVARLDHGRRIEVAPAEDADSSVCFESFIFGFSDIGIGVHETYVGVLFQIVRQAFVCIRSVTVVAVGVGDVLAFRQADRSILCFVQGFPAAGAYINNIVVPSLEFLDDEALVLR